MKIKFGLLTFSIILVNSLLHAQNYTWQTGSGVLDSPGIYGTQGVPSQLNSPGSREPAASWRDGAGNLWIFGGSTSPALNNSFNDLWKYTPSGNTWTFMKGDQVSQQPGVYGTLNTPSPANKPGARSNSVSWTDAQGNFWLFGGIGQASNTQGNLSDLWKYDPTTNNWTWMNGSMYPNLPPSYGTLGVPGSDPGTRFGSTGWADNSGNLWLFGGMTFSNSVVERRNDLWRYNISTNQWTWVAGTNISNHPGNYGTQGTAAAANVPRARTLATGFTDASGNLWLFSGNDYASAFLNDLWRYSITTNEWTWMKGANTTNQAGIYGTQGVASTTTTPGSRFDASSWSDGAGNNFFVYGGSGYGSNNIGMDFLDDLWKYDVAGNQWTWLRGIGSFTQVAVFGTQGTPAPANKPGGMRHCATWTDAANNLWLFGGYGYGSTTSPVGYQNNLWRFGSCTPQYVSVSANSSVICTGNTATLTASGASTYSWSTSQTATTISVAPQVTTVYSVVSTAPNACYLPTNITMSVAALPVVTAITSNSLACVNTSVTLNAGGATTYSWQSGQVTQSITVEATNTVYVVTGTDANGCMKTATVTQAAGECTGINELDKVQQRLSIVPNPSRGYFSVVTSSQVELASVIIMNSLGQLQLKLSNVAANETIGTQLPKGLYYIYAEDAARQRYVGKMVVE